MSLFPRSPENTVFVLFPSSSTHNSIILDPNICPASLNLTLTQTGATDVAAWKYVTFTGEGDAAALVEGKSGSFNVLDTAPVDLHSGASVTGGTDVVYYLMIYLENKNESQNEPGDNLATGSYVGKVTFQAAGGTVSATFAA